MLLPLVLLVVALGGIALLVRRDVEAYRRFKLITDSKARQRQFRVWIAVTFTLFVGYTLLSLALLGRLFQLNQLPPEFAPAWATLGGGAAIAGGQIGGLAIGMAIGGGLAAMIATIARRRKTADRRSARQLGDFAALMPRNRAELAHAAILSINAGLSEELFFRLALPLLFVLVIGNVWVAFALAAIVFGLAHLYQGVVGVVATTAVGVLLTAFYLASGSIWVAVLVHAAIDLVGLVLRPLLDGTVKRAEPAA
jgi:membrane protease YdiL (CAAX protease family)